MVLPATSLRDGQQVEVRALGFGPSHKVYFSECANEAAISALGCGDQLAAQPFALTDDGGQTSTSFTVHPRGFLKPYNTSAWTDCNDQCVLVATTNLSGIGVGEARLGFAH